MAQLPPNGDWLIQQIGDRVVLFHRHTEVEIASAQADSGEDCMRALMRIHKAPELNIEQRSIAGFWFGYFYAYATSFRGHAS